LRKIELADFLKSLWHILFGKPQVPASLQDNELLDLILSRRSVRRFSEQEIPDDIFSAILEAGRLAPSTVNMQTWSFSVFTPESWRKAFGRPLPFRGKRAVIVMGDTHRGKTVLDVFPYSPLVEYTVAVINASLAAMNMNIAAEALGVSSVMLSETGQSGFLDAGYLKEKLALPDGVVPLMTLVFGYAKGLATPMPPKLPRGQVCFKGKYRESDPDVLGTWLTQMMAGFKATHLLSSFEAQLRLYQTKMGQAEVELQEMIFYGDRPSVEEKQKSQHF
jgi:nitroreductase